MFTQAASERQFLHRLNRIQLVIIWLMIPLILLSAIYFLVVGEVRMQGDSMAPALQPEAVAFYLRSPWYRTPRRGDVLFIQVSSRVTEIKRLVGVPGDTILSGATVVVLKSDQYFVVGDNRNDSIDSRSYGLIHANQILGKVVNVTSHGPAFP